MRLIVSRQEARHDRRDQHQSAPHSIACPLRAASRGNNAINPIAAGKVKSGVTARPISSSNCAATPIQITSIASTGSASSQDAPPQGQRHRRDQRGNRKIRTGAGQTMPCRHQTPNPASQSQLGKRWSQSAPSPARPLHTASAKASRNNQGWA